MHVYIYEHVHKHTCGHEQHSLHVEVRGRELFLSFVPCERWGDQTQVIRLGSKCLCLLSLLDCPLRKTLNFWSSCLHTQGPEIQDSIAMPKWSAFVGLGVKVLLCGSIKLETLPPQCWDYQSIPFMANFQFYILVWIFTKWLPNTDKLLNISEKAGVYNV